MTTKEQTIPKGYKHTEVGVIPSDWESKRIGDIFRVTRGQVLSMRKVSPVRLGDYQYPVYSSQTEANGLAGYYTKFLFDSCITWTTDGANAGDVKYRPGKFYCTNVCGVLENKHGYANLCIAAIFNSVSRKYVSYVGNPKLMNNVVADIVIGIPSTIKEQTAIASALSDTDALIEKLTKLIEKKKNIKQGGMQELLTGKRRLPGFSGKWETKKLGEVLKKITTGLNPRQNFQLGKGYNYYVTIKNFSNGKLFLDDRCDKISNEALFLINKRSNLEVGDILFASIGTEPSTYLINTAPRNWNINESVFSIKPDKKIINSSFLQLLLVADWNFEKLSSDATGSTFQSIKIKQLKNLELDFPKLEEQTAIATVLSDMDIEIQRLESQLAKYQNVKQGMMQTLLTGKIRLI